MDTLICPKCNKDNFKFHSEIKSYICYYCNHSCAHDSHKPDVSKLIIEKTSEKTSHKNVNKVSSSSIKNKDIIVVKDNKQKVKSRHVSEYLFVLNILNTLVDKKNTPEPVFCWLDEWLDLGLKISISDIESNFYKFPKINVLKPDSDSFWSFDYNEESITNLMKINTGKNIISLAKLLSCQKINE